MGGMFVRDVAMLPDLPTLLLVRLGVDLLVAVAFWWQTRRFAGISGPGWWSLSGVLGIAGTAGLLGRQMGLDLVVAALASVLLFASHASNWLGLRRYLGLPMPWSLLTGLLVAHVASLAALMGLGFGPAQFQLVYLLVMTAMAVCVLHDLVGDRARRRQPEYRMLAVVTSGELLGLVALCVWMFRGGQALDAVAASFMLFFLLAKFLRVLVLGSLVSLRLRQEVEHTRHDVAEREAESRALVDNLGAGVIVFRPDRFVARINDAARRFLDWPPDHVPRVSGPWPLIAADGQRLPRHEMPFERVLATGLPVSDRVVGIRVGAGVRWALCNAYPDNDALGGLRHVVFTFVDITALRETQQQQRALEQQLAQSQKMEALGTLAGGVAHDFNNILAAILGNADLARQDLVPASPARQSLHEISGAARRGRELVRQILAFSRQQPLARTPVCPAHIVEETCGLLRTAVTSNVQLVRSVSSDRLAILGDANRLGQVLLNLGTNAVHALQGRGGQVAFLVDAVAADDPALPPALAESCRQGGVGAVRIAVRDNGCGMDEATRARIFEPFFTTKDVGQGTGLGLPMVLGIVEAHGGTIAVQSQPGEGTTFTLHFPATAEAPPETAPVPDLGEPDGGTMSGITSGATRSLDNVSAEFTTMSDQPSAAPAHILYLDDDDTLVFLVRRLLERRGYQVTAVCDQQEAIDAVRAQPQAFQLLMTDYNMPGMSGIDVAREVLAINPALPVAVASGYISDELQAEASAAGVTEVVFKTDAVEAFCEVVARLVAPKN